MRHCCAPRRCRKGIHHGDPQSGMMSRTTGDLGQHNNCSSRRAVSCCGRRNVRCGLAQTHTYRPTRQDGYGKTKITRQTNRAGGETPGGPPPPPAEAEHHLIPFVALGKKPIHPQMPTSAATRHDSQSLMVALHGGTAHRHALLLRLEALSTVSTRAPCQRWNNTGPTE
jgi:hypothetical protein